MNNPFKISLRNISQHGHVLLTVERTDKPSKVEYISQQMPTEFAEYIKLLHEAVLGEDEDAKMKVLRMMGEVCKDNDGQYILYSGVYAPGCSPSDEDESA